ncbi:MAG TPA: thioredoxin domain-containing protein [Candidatus Acidoferrales bacterium]|nr:thioredoxin domain-containing protein [Candidatus Acidoferrales bacterium]
MKATIIALIGSAVALSVTQSSRGLPNVQDSEKQHADMGITKEQADKIIQELQVIRMLLESEIKNQRNGEITNSIPRGSTNDPSLERHLTNLGDHLLGNDKAPVTLVEFVDLQCPFCTEFQRDVFPQLNRKYIGTGKLRFAVFDFPLPSHAYATSAAQLALCAASQGKYWEVHDAFLTEPQVAKPDVVQRIAASAQLDSTKLEVCLGSKDTTAELDREISLGRSLEVAGTPTFSLGNSLGTGATGQLVVGAPSWADLDARIQALLKQSAAQRPAAVPHE